MEMNEKFVEIMQNTFEEYLEEKTKALREENKLLKEKVAHLDELEKEYNAKLVDVKKDFISTSIEKIFNDYIPMALNLYRVTYNYIKIPKCNFCDKDRKLEVEDVFGIKHKFRCKCDETRKNFYLDDKSKLITIEKKGLTFDIYISLKDGYNEYYSYTFIEVNLSNDEITHSDNIIEKFDETKPLAYSDNLYFLDKNEAQKYVDWLNKNASSDDRWAD